MTEAHCNNLVKRKALGLVTHDNTGGPFVVECQGCGEVYPSFHCLGGEQIADTGDYDDARCPHCDQVDPEECDNAALAWNTQQLKINALQLMLNNRDDLDDQLTTLEQRRYAEQQAREAAERRVEELEQSVELHAQVIRDQEQMIQNHRLANEKLEIEVQDLHGVVQRLNAARRHVCPNISGGTADRQDAGVDALNPTAEAENHDQ